MMSLFENLKLTAELIKANFSEGIDDGYDHSTTSAGKKGLRSGRVSELTALANLKPGGGENLKKIMEIANGNLKGATKVGTLHDLRIVLLENDTKILFCTAYDGDWDAYIDDFATKIPQLMDIIFGNVEGWPGIKDPSVKQFILDHQVTATGWYVGVPHLTVNDIRRNDKIITGLNKAIDEANQIEK
ncbi:hypothetical protein SAMN05660477_00222 [Soonwooa buanensis]|uniref:Uncharacterized protein n=1 Tax=Soonwooa buanensis TaxID=619805 RepID=A0A1T5CQ13_9FLAO|nr:hypothetical protein [Soonwooa buanensis]SKB61270.1 hypothetical protein SAMN05660477_00222 [Soonwooa buanensis]